MKWSLRHSLLLELRMQAVHERVSVDDDREPVDVIVGDVMRLRHVRCARRFVLGAEITHAVVCDTAVLVQTHFVKIRFHLCLTMV